MKTIFSIGFALILICASTSISAQDLQTHGNAVSVGNEGNSTSGWSGNAVLTADTSDPHHGAYAMKVVSTGTGSTSRRAEYTYTASIGETYDISIWAKTGVQTSDPAFASWTGVTGFTNPTLISTNGAWAEYTFTVTATSTSPLILIYTGSSGGGSVGDELYIDRVSITSQGSADTQSPSTPTNLSSSGNSDMTVDLSWNAATDNVGVTGYNVYQDGTSVATNISSTSHQVTGLTASTTYNFTVTALDAAGNQSIASNAVSVTTDASSGGGSGSSVWSESNSVASYTGDVAIGTSSVPTGYKMAIDGKLITEEVKVQLSGNWPDYVFEEGYDLPTLEEIQKHIKEKGHLPNIPSAEEVKVNGFELGEMDKLLLEKIEELTLHTIEQQKLLNEQQEQIQNLREEVSKLKKNHN
ncbi:fibronectin type III domain-containing protein [Flagellimonas sp. W118]|uniref:fibronectin type III domain-containing protein n=1 Tax=Flagellimonas sp. W118 TaxID=3410791 RepID=UPI003BF4C3CF